MRKSYHNIKTANYMLKFTKRGLYVNTIKFCKTNIKLNKVNILSKIQKVIAYYTEPAKIKNISLLLHKVGNEHYAFADSDLIDMILDNVISNAVRYSFYDKHVNIHICNFETMVRCEIKDEGPGLSESDQEQVFNTFSNLTSNPIGQESDYGYSMGLFLVKNWVEAMHGKVWCESELDKGTSFFVEFPLFDSQEGVI